MNNYTGAYVINLEANKDRKKKFLEEWNNIDPRINIVKAVDTRGNLWKNYKQHISEKAIEELYDNERSFFIQGFDLGESYADSKFQSEAVRAYNRLYKTNN